MLRALLFLALAACSSGHGSDPGGDGAVPQCPADLGQACSAGDTCSSTSVGSAMCIIPFSCSCNAGRWKCQSAGNGQCQCAPFAQGLVTGTACNVPALVCTRSATESGCKSNNDCSCDGVTFTCPPTCGADGG